MHSWEQLRTALANPRRLLRGVAHPKRRLLETHDTVMRHTARERAGVDVPAADWDNLLILDACRYDAFAAANGLDGTLEAVYSRASRTSEFLRVNFAGGTHRDTVYVTANPMHTSIAGVDRVFSEIVPVHRDEWDDELQTVHPETMTEALLAAAEEYPHKRLIGHYNQPHVPYLGAGRERLARLAADSPDLAPDVFGRFDVVADNGKSVPVWQLLRAGHLSRAGAFEAYRECLDVALPHVERALAALPGRSVVTADHGEAFGERGPFGLRVYGHPGRVFMDELVRVPWLEVPADERKTIREADTGPSEANYEGVEERLEHLGYA